MVIDAIKARLRELFRGKEEPVEVEELDPVPQDAPQLEAPEIPQQDIEPVVEEEVPPIEPDALTKERLEALVKGEVDLTKLNPAENAKVDELLRREAETDMDLPDSVASQVDQLRAMIPPWPKEEEPKLLPADAHNILDGDVHTDSVADSVTKGSLIIGNATPKWDELLVTDKGVLISRAAATNGVEWLAGVAGDVLVHNGTSWTVLNKPGNGTFFLKCVVTTGTPVISWAGSTTFVCP